MHRYAGRMQIVFFAAFELIGRMLGDTLRVERRTPIWARVVGAALVVLAAVIGAALVALAFLVIAGIVQS